MVPHGAIVENGGLGNCVPGNKFGCVPLNYMNIIVEASKKTRLFERPHFWETWILLKTHISGKWISREDGFVCVEH